MYQYTRLDAEKWESKPKNGNQNKKNGSQNRGAYLLYWLSREYSLGHLEVIPSIDGLVQDCGISSANALEIIRIHYTLMW